MRIHRGRWEPLIPERWRTAVVSIIPVSMLMIGTDYMLSSDTAALAQIERAAPLPMWGAALVLAGLMTIGGFVGHWRHIAIGGLHLGGALMLTLGVGIGVETMSWTGGFRWAGLYVLLGAASWCAAFGYWMQVEPPADEES
ncbi:MAG: hypothetical protein QM582_14495 [Micropruina sp.]|uniref:hypothetical protein n=1 Tax=Micropruina sp. TaxID=2737536 RepID=UPI0039E46263